MTTTLLLNVSVILTVYCGTNIRRIGVKRTVNRPENRWHCPCCADTDTHLHSSSSHCFRCENELFY